MEATDQSRNQMKWLASYEYCWNKLTVNLGIKLFNMKLGTLKTMNYAPYGNIKISTILEIKRK